MQNRRKESLFVAALVAALLALAATVALPSHGQSAAQDGAARPRVVNDAPKESAKADAKTEVAKETAGAESKSAEAGTNKTAATTDGASATNPAGAAAATNATSATGATAPSSVSSSSFAAAARQNVSLSGDLEWVFGGKQQRGWSLYEPLVERTLAVESGPDSGAFAQAVARWQSALGLGASGVIDRDSWMGMVGLWQSRRLKDHTYPSPDQLVTVEPAEFYDPARPAELRQVERNTYAAYRRMIASAAADKSLGLQLDAEGRLADSEKFFKIVSAFRSREYQDRLRREQPGAGRAALAVNSPHFTGRALDLYVGGYDPVSTKDDNRALQTQTKAYRWLVRHAEEFGFRPYYFEPWHWEYVGG